MRAPQRTVVSTTTPTRWAAVRRNIPAYTPMMTRERRSSETVFAALVGHLVQQGWQIRLPPRRGSPYDWDWSDFGPSVRISPWP
jgi:hypothetical protein